MDLFLETPQQKAERLLRQQERLFEMQQRAAQDGASAPAPGGDSEMFDTGHGFAAASKEASRAQDYSVQQDEYRRELDYDRERARRRRVGQWLHTLLMIVLVPLGLAAIFIASYALTCILNGASPSEVVQHFQALGQRIGDLITLICANWGL